MNLWKRIEYWNLEASECFFHNDIHTALLITIHALQYLYQHTNIATKTNNIILDSNSDSMNSYIDFISGYDCINSSSDATTCGTRNEQKVPILPNNDPKNVIISNYDAITDIKNTASSNMPSCYNPDCNDICQEFPKTTTTVITSFNVSQVRQLLKTSIIEDNNEFEIVDEEIYSSFFVWKTNHILVSKVNNNTEGSSSSLNSRTNEDDVDILSSSSCISTDEMMMILIYNIALLHHRQASSDKHNNCDNDYMIAIESYHQALQIFEDKILPNNKNSKTVNENNRSLYCCKSTSFLLMKAVILNNLMHIYNTLYQIDEALQAVNVLENHLLLCSNHHSLSDEYNNMYDGHHCNHCPCRRIEQRKPANINIVERNDDDSISTIINLHHDNDDDNNHNYEDDHDDDDDSNYYSSSFIISDEDYDFFEMNVRYIRMHNFQNSPAA